MTPERLEQIKAMQHGPVVDELIAEVEKGNRAANDLLAQMEARAVAAEAEVARLRGDEERLDWLEDQLAEWMYRADLAIQSDEEDGVWLARITRFDCGELKGIPYDASTKTETVRAAIDAARKERP